MLGDNAPVLQLIVFIDIQRFTFFDTPLGSTVALVIIEEIGVQSDDFVISPD